MKIGENLKKLRTEKGMSQKQLADELIVSPQAVSRWENDEVEPDISTLTKLSEIFNVSVDQLITGKQEKKEQTVVKTVVVPVPQPVVNNPAQTFQPRPVINTCDVCHKNLYSESEYSIDHIYVRHGRHSTKKERVICNNCKKIQEENRIAAAKAKKKEDKKKHKVKIIISSIVGIVGFIVALIVTISQGLSAGGVIGLSLLSLYVCFSTLYCILVYSYISHVFLAVSSVSIKFPGLIFSWDIDGIIWVICMKITFAILGFLFGLACAVFAVILSAFLSVFSFPFIFGHNLKHGYED